MCAQQGLGGADASRLVALADLRLGLHIRWSRGGLHLAPSRKLVSAPLAPMTSVSSPAGICISRSIFPGIRIDGEFSVVGAQVECCFHAGLDEPLSACKMELEYSQQVSSDPHDEE